MTEQHEPSTTELADLATRLRDLDWSWELNDVPDLTAEFGWRAVVSRPDWVILDTGLGVGSGKVHGEDGKAVRIETRLTEFVEEDEAGAEDLRTTFDEITDVLTEVLGHPTARIPGQWPQIRWAGPARTVVLVRSPVSVVLYLVTNTRLAADDRNVEFEKRNPR